MFAQREPAAEKCGERGPGGSSTIQEGWAGRSGAKGGYGVGRDAWGRGRLQHRAPLREAEESFAGRG